MFSTILILLSVLSLVLGGIAIAARHFAQPAPEKVFVRHEEDKGR